MSPSPTRRQLLSTTAALGLGTSIAGCNQATSPASTTPNETNSNPTTTPSTSTTPRATVALSQESHVAKAWTTPQHRFTFPKGDAVPLSELDAAVRTPVQTAIETPAYTTTDPSQELLAAIDDVDLITHEDTVWTVEHTFPTVTIRLDTKIATDEPVDEQTVRHDADVIRSNDAIANVVSTIAPTGVETEPRPYETTQLAPVVQEFLDTYDYITTPRGPGELVVSRTTRSPPHTIRAREATDEELYGRQIRAAADYGPPTNQFIDRLLASDRKTPANYQDRIHVRYPDDVPWQFARDIDSGSNYVRVDDDIYGFDTRHLHWNELPISVTATNPDDTDSSTDPVDIQLAVRNTGPKTVELLMAGVSPFGVLWADGPDGERVLWNDAYEDTEHIDIKNDQVVPESRAELVLGTGETQSRQYRLGHDNLDTNTTLQPGTYEVLGSLWAKWPTYDGANEYDWRSQLFPYTLTIEID